MKALLISLLILGIGSGAHVGCAVLKPPFHTSKTPPVLTLEASQALPGKLFLKLHVHAPMRVGPDIEIFRAIGDDDFRSWKIIKISDFEDELHRGLIVVDSKLAYGEEVFYQARSVRGDSVFTSEELRFFKEKGPNPPKNLRTVVFEKTIKIEWDVSDTFSHVVIYRRNIVEDSPIVMVSNLVKDSSWTDDNVESNGVYSYQVVSAKLQQSVLQYGSFSEPLYVTVE